MRLLNTDKFNFDTLKLVPLEGRRGPAGQSGGAVRDFHSIAIVYDAPFGKEPYLFWDVLEQETLGV